MGDLKYLFAYTIPLSTFVSFYLGGYFSFFTLGSEITTNCHGCKFAPLGAVPAALMQFLIMEKGICFLKKCLIVLLDLIELKKLDECFFISFSENSSSGLYGIKSGLFIITPSYFIVLNYPKSKRTETKISSYSDSVINIWKIECWQLR